MDAPWVPPVEGRCSRPASPAIGKDALSLYRAQQASLAARAAMGRIPSLSEFPVALVEQAIIQAKADCLTRGVKLDLPGSRNLIEAEALAILQASRP